MKGRKKMKSHQYHETDAEVTARVNGSIRREWTRRPCTIAFGSIRNKKHPKHPVKYGEDDW